MTRLLIPLLDYDGAARVLRLKKCQVKRLVKANAIPYVEPIEGEIRFDEADLMVWIQKKKSVSPDGDDQESGETGETAGEKGE